MTDPLADLSRYKSLAMDLLRAREAVMARMRPMLRGHGVTEQQWRVLRTLAEAPAMEPAELARQAYLLRPSLTRILRDLQERGLVQRAPSAPASKRHLMSITESGRRLVAATVADAAAIQDEIERMYGAQALVEMRRSLAALERCLSLDRG